MLNFFFFSCIYVFFFTYLYFLWLTDSAYICSAFPTISHVAPSIGLLWNLHAFILKYSREGFKLNYI